MRLIIGMGGASGIIHGIRLLEILQPMADVETHLVMSKTARITLAVETEYSLDRVEAMADHVHKIGNVAASIASGSFQTDGMILAACSMKNLSAVVHSMADDLLTRAADVCLKEQRRLVLMPRETPLHAGHCALLLDAARLGAIIAPPMPAFYIKPQTIDDLVDHSVGRVLDLFGIDSQGVKRWTGPMAEDYTDETVDQDASAFWAFSLALYGRDDVAEACLYLQDHLGANVNLILYLCFRWRAHQLVLSRMIWRSCARPWIIMMRRSCAPCGRFGAG
ncbi:hypothetical protein JCM17846_22870 [Iodidimonas nitroreducens]|uniref:Flavin prenyltransferase UbiX n=1 Tax=Iodidimonas nitroreducens TaxID=1236968 RepID=A0A5A7NAC1_9PROT|nr:hypothetical protein JCM17846_22870 [Iodidimonas nitroreducens]